MFITFGSCKKEALPCLPPDLYENVIAFYPFTQGSLNDYSGNVLHLVNPYRKAIPTEDKEGNQNCAYRFFGDVESYLSRNGRFLDNFQKKPFSISLWYRPENLDGGKYEVLLSRTLNPFVDPLPSSIEWGVNLYDCGRIVFDLNRKTYWEGDNNDFPLPCLPLIEYFYDKWHHVVVTFDGTDRHIYRNGQNTIAQTRRSFYNRMSRNKGDMFIGLDFVGDIDDIIIFDKVLSEHEIASLYNLQSCCQ